MEQGGGDWRTLWVDLADLTPCLLPNPLPFKLRRTRNGARTDLCLGSIRISNPPLL